MSAETNRRSLSLSSSLMLVLPLLLILLVVFLWPILRLIATSLFDPDFTLRHYQAVLSDDFTLIIFWRTFKVSFLVAALALIIGFPIANLMRNASPMGATIIGACVLIPLWTSVLVRSFAWTVFLQRNGVFNTFLQWTGITDAPIGFLYNETAVIVAQAHVMLPFMVMPIYQSLRAIPEEFPRAALSLGASHGSVFRHVIWPLARPGVTAGFLIVFIVSLGAFVTPALIGGPRTMMLATAISNEITEKFDWARGATLSAILLIAVLVLIAIFNRFMKLNQLDQR